MISQLAAQIFASGEGVDEPADESFIASLKHEPVTEADVAAQKACSVCLVEFSLEDTSVCKLACTHGFHIDCLKPWLARAHTCPVCRLELRAAQASASSESSGSSGSSGPSNPERVSGRSDAKQEFFRVETALMTGCHQLREFAIGGSAKPGVLAKKLRQHGARAARVERKRISIAMIGEFFEQLFSQARLAHL